MKTLLRSDKQIVLFYRDTGVECTVQEEFQEQWNMISVKEISEQVPAPSQSYYHAAPLQSYYHMFTCCSFAKLLSHVYLLLLCKVIITCLLQDIENYLKRVGIATMEGYGLKKANNKKKPSKRKRNVKMLNSHLDAKMLKEFDWCYVI